MRALNFLVALLILVLGAVVFATFGYLLVYPRVGPRPTPDQGGFSQDPSSSLLTSTALVQQLSELETRLASAAAQADAWKRSSELACARAGALEQRLASVTAEAANWKRFSSIAAGRAKEAEHKLASATADLATRDQKAALSRARIEELARHQFTLSAPDDRFLQLRALLAKELHPDHTKAEGFERIIRTELFKALWPRIDEI